MNPLDKQRREKLYWASVILYFALFSFNALATSLIASLIGVKWELLSMQEKFSIAVAIVANWTGMVLVFIQRGMTRLAQGKGPVPTGDTDLLTKA